MKKIILILILVFTYSVSAQSAIGTEDSTTVMYDTDRFPVDRPSTEKSLSLSWFRMKQLINAQSGSNILGLDNHFTGKNQFDYLQVGGSSMVGYVNGIWGGTDSTFHGYLKDGNNDKFQVDLATKQWVNAQNFGSGTTGSYWSLSGDQSGISGLKTMSSGGVKMTGSADFVINMYYLGSAPSTFAIGKLYGNYTNDYFRLKVQHELQGGVQKTAELISVSEAKAMNDSLVAVEYATLSGADTLDWTTRKLITELNVPQTGDHSYYFKNYGAGQYTLYIYTQESQNFTFSANGVSFKWTSGGKPTNFQGRWLITFLAKSAGLCLVTAVKYEE